MNDSISVDNEDIFKSHIIAKYSKLVKLSASENKVNQKSLYIDDNGYPQGSYRRLHMWE